MEYLGVFLGSVAVTGISIYISTVMDNSFITFIIHTIAGIITYSISLISLSFSAAEQWKLKEKLRKRHGRLRPFQFWPLETAIFATRMTGLVAGIYVMILPTFSPAESLVVDVLLRCLTFFYACKILDLAIVRANKPPILRLGQDRVLYGLTDSKAHAEYVWKAFSETRYPSFNIAVDESRRKSTPTYVAWTYAPLLLLPLTYVVPIAELQIMSGLLGLNLLFEGQHMLLHPWCPNWLFWQPFSAVTITEFWGLRWHKGANSFLHSLAYVPAKSIFGRFFGHNVGKAAGVLSAFSLSGIWHAWCSVPLTKEEHIWGVSVGLWAVFMLQGIGILIEGWLLRDEKWKRGRRQQILRVQGWIYSVETASLWLRFSLPRAKKL